VTDVAIEGLEKDFGGFRALHGIDLGIADGEFVTLLGPSGCGKTTTLRCLAGLEAPSAGSVRVGSELFACAERGIFVPPEKRSVGMVFQSYALWPHMTVRSNVAYPLKLARRPRDEIRSRVREILERIGLADREGEMAAALSGGQQQRIALARALVARPSLMLFDEPLSNLDAKLRYGMRNEIRSLHDAYGMTSVYVTHDQEEAIALSDRIVVMNEGNIEQIGTPRELYTRPANVFVADFMGFQNLLEGRVTGRDGRLHTVEAEGIRCTVETPEPVETGVAVVLAFRASHLVVGATGDAPSGTRMRGIVRHETYLGSALRLLVEVGRTRIRTELGEADLERLGVDLPGIGDEVSLTIPPRRIVLLRAAEPTPSTRPDAAVPETATSMPR
jgi:iron(III) transport system ATP-binding protein